MSDAARLARQTFSTKPPGTPYSKFTISTPTQQAIIGKLRESSIDAAYASVISYAEALAGIQKNSSSWAIIRLYYSCFFCIKSLLLLNQIVPFNCNEEMILVLSEKKFRKGGKSSHHWNWATIRATPVGGIWFCSQDSQEAYDKLRKYRENVNYTHGFTDPELHNCLVYNEFDLAKRFRIYRDDGSFLYTYLDNHLAISYPTKLIFLLDGELRRIGLALQPDRISHIRTIWQFRDRCPLT